MKHFYIITWFILLPFIGLGQSNFTQGLIITHKADTLKGFINYQEWSRNPEKITFKTSLSAAEQIFTENDIVFFEVFNKEEAYRRFITTISMDKVEFPNLSVGPDTSRSIKAVFLKYIEKGNNIDLLSYTDGLKSRHFIFDKQTLDELIYKKYFIDNVKEGFATDNRYKGQLLVLSQKYPVDNLDRLKGKINKASYLLSSIAPLVREINADSSTVEKISSIRFFAGVTANYGYTVYKGDVPLGNGATNKASFTPGFTIGMDAFLNKRTKRLLFRNELSFSTNKASMFKKEELKSVSHSFEQTILSVSPQVVYHLHATDNFRVNIGGGFSGNFGKTSKNFYQEKFANPSSGYGDINKEDGIEINKFWFAMPVRAGVVISKSWEASILYVYPLSSITAYPAFSINSSAYKMGLNYLFNSK